jgi:peptidoglycan/xylan/chitin deacetylase (PgdA/CDA1 family)
MNQPNVAITIDDGYGKKSIEYILNIFEKNNIKATFFVI